MKNLITTSALIAGLLLSGSALANGAQNGATHGNTANSASISGSASVNGGNTQGVTIEGSTSYGGDIPRQAPSIAAPALTTTLSETCMGSTSFGASGPGFGITFGSTWRDEACVRRLDARELRSFGAGLNYGDAIIFHLAAKERMCEDGKVRAAFERVAKMIKNPDALCQQSADEQQAAAAQRVHERAAGLEPTREQRVAAAEEKDPWAHTSGSDR